MRNSVKESVHQSVVLRAVVAMLLVAVTVAAAFGFKAAGQQPNQPATQQAPPPPRPAITMASPEDAAREMNNPRGKWFREAKYGLFIHWGL